MLLQQAAEAAPNLLKVAKQLAEASSDLNIPLVLQGVSLKRRQIMRFVPPPNAWLLVHNQLNTDSSLFQSRVLTYLDRWGHQDMALQTFAWMEGHPHAFDTADPFLYTRLMSMCGQQPGGSHRALHIFNSMQSKGIRPDLVAFNTAINVAGEQAWCSLSAACCTAFCYSFAYGTTPL